MGENRKPIICMLLKIKATEGKIKRQKVEIYNACDFGYIHTGRCSAAKYRIRVNGKWFNQGIFYYKTQIRDMLHKSLPW